MRQLWVLAGGNGAGKSTFYQLRLRPLGVPFINADRIAREIYPEDPEGNSYRAARLAEEMRLQQLLTGNSFCFETVFSHPSKIDFLARSKALGYQVILVLIHLADSSLNRARVAQRVAEGGHHVPDDKVASRIPRTLANVKKAMPLCDRFYTLDNSSAESPFRPVLTVIRGRITRHERPLPDWAEELVRTGP